jgi:crossover junction endodeoxyribonuclease RuvC
VASPGIRALGIDPGLVRTGWAVVQAQDDSYELIAAGVIAPDAKGDFGARLLEGFDGITAVIDETRPHLVAIEELFSSPAHPAASLAMAHMRGVLCLAVERAALPARHFTATTVKQRITGSGHASKEQVRHMVFQLCGMPPQRARLDLTDAVALAITAITSEDALRMASNDRSMVTSSRKQRSMSVLALLAERGVGVPDLEVRGR